MSGGPAYSTTRTMTAKIVTMRMLNLNNIMEKMMAIGYIVVFSIWAWLIITDKGDE